MIQESVQKVIEEMNSNSPVLEAVLSAVLQHMAGKEDAEPGTTVPVVKHPHFAVLTSWRKFDWKDDEDVRSGDEKIIGQQISRRFGSNAAKSREVNQRNYEAIIAHFQKLGLPVTRLTGSWLETGNSVTTDPFERSIFVAGDKHGQEIDSDTGKLNLSDVQSLGRKYNQDSIIYAGPNTYGMVKLYGQDRKTGEWSQWASWRNIKVDAAKDIAQQLQSQKRRLLGSTIKRWLGIKPKDDYANAGASQVGGEGRGKIGFLGTPKTDPEASSKAFRFAENIIEQLCFPCDHPKRGYKFVYESAGMTPADLGVGLLDISKGDHYQVARNIKETLISSKVVGKEISLEKIGEIIRELS